MRGLIVSLFLIGLPAASYAAEPEPLTSSFTVTHANNSQTDRSFVYATLG